MFRSFVRVALLAAPIIVAGQAQAQETASVPDADASVTIILPITIAQTTALNFGRIVKGDEAGSVTVNKDTGAFDFTNAGGAVAASGAGIAPSRGVFTVGGEAGTGFDIDVDASVVLTSQNDDELTVTLTGDGTGTLSGTLGSAVAGSATVYVGGSLALLADTPAGSYTGTYAISVTYN
ncbi:MAG: DUF4402 domain-containing protein [Sphingomonadales bacterium]|nr:DUF4402 domain-containing protein [Sphingomonadales bacterium]